MTRGSEKTRPAYVDVSHTIKHGLVTYRGLPAPVICDFLSRRDSRDRYAPGTEFHIGRIDMVANSGTYVDSPFHRFEGRDDVAQMSLESLADLDGIVVRAARRTSRSIDRGFFEGLDLAGKAVLVHTGWAEHWGTDQYFEGHPFLTRESAEYLVQGGAALVGIDSLNIDDTNDGRRPVHTTLLGHDIPIVEHMTNLEALPDEGFRFFAAPVKVEGMGSFPVRAFALTRTRTK